jgi:sugar phosphate permease
MFLYAVGAIGAPYVASVLIEHYGSAAMFVFISVAHLVLIAFGLYRMRVRPTEPSRTPYVTAPRTSFIIGRLLKRSRDGES